MRILRLFVKATGVWSCSQFRASSTDCREAASYSFPSEGQILDGGQPFAHSPKHLCLPKTSSRSTSHRINNIRVDLLWGVARQGKTCNIVAWMNSRWTEFLRTTGAKDSNPRPSRF